MLNVIGAATGCQVEAPIRKCHPNSDPEDSTVDGAFDPNDDWDKAHMLPSNDPTGGDNPVRQFTPDGYPNPGIKGVPGFTTL
jgi:hypothetical protein